MAIINCPGCGRRISDQSSSCAHCNLTLGEMSDDDIKQLERRRWRQRVFVVRNVTYLGMAALLVGAIWWFMLSTGGATQSPPLFSAVLLGGGLIVYLCGRGWLFWLNMKRNRPG